MALGLLRYMTKIKGELTDETWNARKGVLQEFIEQSNNFSKQFKEKPAGVKRAIK